MSDPIQPHPRRGYDVEDVTDSDVDLVREFLQDSFTSDYGMRRWLVASNRYLDFRQPLALVRAGNGREVKEAALAFQEGIYL